MNEDTVREEVVETRENAVGVENCSVDRRSVGRRSVGHECKAQEQKSTDSKRNKSKPNSIVDSDAAGSPSGGALTNSQSAGGSAFTVDSFSDGIAFGQHRLPAGDQLCDHYDLKVSSEGEVAHLRSRYALHRTNPLWELERHLMRLSRQGILGSSTIFFGTSTDPFFPFEGKFDASMKFLSLFERYTPGLLVVQTRSPLLVIAMPVLKKLGRHAAVTIAIETPLDDVMRKYTPGFTRIEERLRAATALRRFGIEVTLQVAPVLPYGDWRQDAAGFAELLDAHGDRITVRALNRGTRECEKRVRASTVAKRLAQDRKFQWLRPDAANPLLNALDERCPAKLEPRPNLVAKKRQMSIFAA